MSQQRPHKGEIHPLTSFRWIIGLALFLHHAVNYFMFAEVGPAWNIEDLSQSQVLLHQGTGAVAFFFLLSGFTLTYNYAEKFRSLGARAMSLFYVNRVASIWPMHLLILAMMAPFFIDDLIAAPLAIATVLLPATLLMQAWLPLGGPDTWTLGFNGPSWSLSALMFFYLCFPFAVSLLGRLDRTRPRALVVLPVVCTAVVGLMAYAWASDAYSSWAFHTYPLFRLLDFLVGVCACLIFLRTVKAARLRGEGQSGWRLPGGTAGATLIEIGTVGLIGLTVVFHDLVPLTVRYSAWFVLPLALMVYAFARGGGLLSAAISIRPLRYLGRISFAFLMVHVAIMQYMFSAGIYARGAMTASIVAFVLSLGASVAIYHLWEGPMRRAIRARAGSWVAHQFDRAQHDADQDAASEQIALDGPATTRRDEPAA